MVKTSALSKGVSISAWRLAILFEFSAVFPYSTSTYRDSLELLYFNGLPKSSLTHSLVHSVLHNIGTKNHP